MKLEKFDNKEKRLKVLIFTIFFVLLGIGIGKIIEFTLANFSVNKTFNVIEGTVKYEGSGDVMFSFYVDNVASDTMPSINDQYAFEKGECTNGTTITWNQTNWAPRVDNLTLTKTKCSLYFKKKPSISESIIEKAKTDTTNLASDDPDGNIRYIGKNPNNYITFNGEKAGWRIIGSFKDIDDGTGRTEWRTKIIKVASIGNKAWDTDSANGGFGINEWSTSDIKIYLNDTYYPGLTQGAKDMIGDTIWNLGTNGSANYQTATPSAFYGYEGSNNTGKICSGGLYCNDTVTRTTKWTGKIGLMYPSDYGYATGGSTRGTCLNTAISSWNNNASCYNNDWLYISGTNQWTMTPSANSSDALYVFYVLSSGFMSYYRVDYTLGVRPVVYLSSNVQILGGSGTSADPYQLSV